MDDEINDVRTCLDDALKKPHVDNSDLARAMRGFIIQCYQPHVRMTQGNSRKVDEIIETIRPIAEWVKPKIIKEQKWSDERRKFLMTMLAVAVPVVAGWLMIVFSEGLRAWLLHFLTAR